MSRAYAGCPVEPRHSAGRTRATQCHLQMRGPATFVVSRFTERPKIPNWWRSSRFSNWSAARDLKAKNAEEAHTWKAMSAGTWSW